jgi:hypothetical protein
VGPQQAVTTRVRAMTFNIARSGASPPNLNAFHAFMRILQFRSLFGGG